MAGFTKLFSTIVRSSVWMESLPTKVVWITMLALADGSGKVTASLPGLAHTAGVTLEECELALQKFLSPDKHSQTKTDDGRRIAEVDGGWILLNYGKYREKLSPQDRKERDAERKRLARARPQNRTSADMSGRPASASERDISETEPSSNPYSSARRCEESFSCSGAADRDEVQALHAAWKKAVGWPEAKLRRGSIDAITLADAIDLYGLDKCLLVAENANSDGMVSGKSDQRKESHPSIGYIFGNDNTFNRILHAVKEKIKPTKTKQSAEEAKQAMMRMQTDPRRDPKPKVVGQ